MSRNPGFHASELAVQASSGVSPGRQARAAAAIQPIISAHQRLFFENLPLLFLGLIDERGRPWATIATGRPGFARSPEPGRLDIAAKPVLAGPLNLVTGKGAKIGVLGIELSTRRRNRINGTIIAELENGGIAVAVDQCFGNCPQYIQARNFTEERDDRSASRCMLAGFSVEARRIIETADTFFIASRSAELGDGPNAGLDVSHRGGRPGFLGMNSDGSLSFPDFAGNRFFNTLGNIASDGRVGILVPEFATGDALYVTGRAAIDWNSARVGRFEGAERVVDVQPETIWVVRHALPAVTEFVQMSPRLEGTGTWSEVNAGCDRNIG